MTRSFFTLLLISLLSISLLTGCSQDTAQDDSSESKSTDDKSQLTAESSNNASKTGAVKASAADKKLAEQMALVAANQGANIVQPGLPGAESQLINAEQASDLASNLYNDADILFMNGMIMHHAQAVEMVALVNERSKNKELMELAKRIDASQKDEIKMMQTWLTERDQLITSMHAHHDENTELMPGMLNADEMKALAAASGSEFDKLFLEGMIKHHYGAIVMVKALLDADGAAQDAVMYSFATDVRADQTNEIKRMGKMLAKLSPDPRVDLAAGYLDAEQAIQNLELVTSISKPQGFYFPDMPAGLPVDDQDTEQDFELPKSSKPVSEMTDIEKELYQEQKALAEEKQDNAIKARDRQTDSAVFNFANTDIAFSGDTLALGNYHGFNLYDIKQADQPKLISSVVCPGGQGDVSIVGDLLIMSVEQSRGRLDCGLQGVPEKVSDSRFRGLRIFDISDRAMPKQVAAVQTCRGSHTHTIVNEPNAENKIYVYNSGTAHVREQEEMESCIDAAHDDDTALFSIDVIEIPLDNPSKARIVNSPRIFADPETGNIGGLWRGGDHGTGTQQTYETSACHDITVFPEMNLAAGACSGNGILMDISDPLNPVRLDAVADQSFAYWHSATFNNDGTKVIFTDEWGGGSRPRCRANDPVTWGANAIYDIVDGKLEFRSYYKLPAPQSEQENCVAHNGSLLPIPGRDIMVQSWYQGGLSIFDFTDSANPKEIAYFDRGPLHAKTLITGGYWSSYWYKGYIYGSAIARGLDVLRLTESEHLSANEIAASMLVDAKVMNTQYQRTLNWPAHAHVALAYIDQLQRIDNMPENVMNLLAKIKSALVDESIEVNEFAAIALDISTKASDLPAKAFKPLSGLSAILAKL